MSTFIMMVQIDAQKNMRIEKSFCILPMCDGLSKLVAPSGAMAITASSMARRDSISHSKAWICSSCNSLVSRSITMSSVAVST